MEIQSPTNVKLSLDQLKAFCLTLTPGSLLEEATRHVISEFERRTTEAERQHWARYRHWD